MIPASEQNHGQPLAEPRSGAPTGAARLLVSAVNALIKRTGGIRGEAFGPLPEYTVAQVTAGTPDPVANAKCLIYVSDGASNKRMAVSDGAAWRFPDGNVVS